MRREHCADNPGRPQVQPHQAAVPANAAETQVHRVDTVLRVLDAVTGQEDARHSQQYELACQYEGPKHQSRHYTVTAAAKKDHEVMEPELEVQQEQIFE